MSRLSMIAPATAGHHSTGGGGGDPPPPPPPDEPQLTRPASTDPVLLALRPAGRKVATYSVDPGFATSSTNFHTIGDAMTAAGDAVANAIQQTSIATEFSIYGNPRGPDYAVDIIIATGAYPEDLGGNDFVALFSATGDPADVTINSVHSFGSLYMEGLTLKTVSPDGITSAKYPWHITGGAQMAAAKCVLDIVDAVIGDPDSTTQGVIGMDGADGAFLTLYDVTPHANPGDPAMNLHGPADGANVVTPITVAFIDCDVTDIDHIGFSGTPVTGAGLNAFYAIGCTGLTDIAVSANEHVYTDDMAATVATSGALTRPTSTWPTPVDGLSTHWTGFYYPSGIGTIHDEALGAGDQAAFTPPAGRMWWVPAHVSSAIHVTHHGVRTAGAGGTAGVRVTRDASPPTDQGTQSLGTLAAGDNFVEWFLYNTLYPGETHAWVIVETLTGTPTYMGSLANAAGAYYSDDGGATILPVPGGTRVPVALLREAT